MPDNEIESKVKEVEKGEGDKKDFKRAYKEAFGGLKAKGIGMPEIDWTKLILIFAIIGIIIIVVFWFFSVGGGQVSAGLGDRISRGIGAIFDSYAIKSFINALSNPFGIQPTSGEYEEVQSTQPKTPPPNQAFSVEIRGATDNVLLDQKALMFIVKVNNLGSSKISKIDLSVDLLPPYSGCLVFDPDDDGNFERGKAEISDIAPFSSKEKIFSSGKIDGRCIVEKLGGSKLKPKIPVGNIFAYAKATTYYPTASRLAVERIKEDYGVLLIRNDVLRQQKTGAIYRSGSALTIDMDIGDQPIFDSVTKAGLLMRWQNLGKGKMPANMKPFLFIVTPNNFGKCIPAGYGKYTNPSSAQCDNPNGCIICDEELETWCSENSLVYLMLEKYAPHAKSIFDWMCGLIDKGFHVCATTTLTEEFNVFSCSLELPGQIETNENRVTDYITAAAIYPYEVKSPSLGIKAYCIESQTDICEPS